MASGFEGWISIAEDLAYDSSSRSNPQLLYADGESLSLGKEIYFQPIKARDSHVAHVSSPVYKAAKPSGEITFQFRSDDCLKVLAAHFQNGTILSSVSPFQYAFYPRKNSLDYNYRGTQANHPYGSIVARPYTVTVTKKHFDTSLNGGTNTFIFKHGVVDKLDFKLETGNDAKFIPHFQFRDFDAGTAITENPGDFTVGSYSAFPSFQSFSGTVTLNGGTFEIASLEFSSLHQTQEYSRLGRQAPEFYQMSDYSLMGAFGFDLPRDALSHVGSMFSGGTFSISATLYNSANDSVAIEMPCCVRAPFDYNLSGGDSLQAGRIPFHAFESNGTYPIKISINTTSAPLYSNIFGDALFGARSIPSGSWYDAGNGARVLSSYTYYSRS